MVMRKKTPQQYEARARIARALAHPTRRAEDGRGVIVRLHEESGRPAEVKLSFTGLPIREAVFTDVTEHDQAAAPVSEGAVVFSLGPYALKTVRLVVEGPGRE